MSKIKYFIYLLIPLVASTCAPERPIKKYRVAFSQCCADPWREVMEREMRRELAFHSELEFEIRSAENNSQTQTEQIREMVQNGVDLLIVSPNESEPLTPVVEEVFEAGIPVILIDRKTESQKFTAYLGADNFEIGRTAAQYIAAHFPKNAEIIELQLGMKMTPARDRSAGFRSALAQYPQLKIVAPLEMTAGLDELKIEFQRTLAEHPEADIVFGHNDFLAENAFRWAQESGRSGLFFVGIDGIPGLGQGIQAVEDGVLDASLLYPTGGEEAIRLAISVLNNMPFEKENTLQTIVINASNARMLHLQMKKQESLQRSIDEQMKGLSDLKTIYRNQQVYILILVLSLLTAVVLGAILYKSLRTKEKINLSLEIKTREALEHEQQILKMSDELRDATQAKVDFFTNISHEFRTPLTLILGYVEGLLNSGASEKTAKQDLGMVRKNALRLLRLINQLMDFRKIESGKMAVRASENDLVEFTREIVEAYRKMAEKRGIQLDFFAVESSLPVWFDVNMLDKVLFNLLSNAFKFTPDGGKIQVAVVIDPIAEKAIVKVEDNGRGMSSQHVEQAFERFFQGTTHKTSGTGLGLSLSKELVNLHSGDIELWSERGKGARFEVSLPLGKAHFRDEQILKEKAEGISYDAEVLFFEEEKPSFFATEPSEKPSEQTLLLIEDNEDLRHFLKKEFSKNYQIREAADGNAGLKMAFDEVPDLIIADITMPGRDGLELTKILKNDLRSSHIPIVLLTARGTMEQKIEGIQTGADAYVTKPFNLVFLSEIVKNLLRGRENLRAVFGGNLKLEKLPSGLGNLDQQFLRKFTDFIEAHFADQNLTVEKLSEEFGLSRVQLFRKTKALLGDSPNDFIQNVRLKHAAQLLRESQLNIAEIAYLTGYSSPGYFSTAFRGKFGCSPSEWREKPRVF